MTNRALLRMTNRALLRMTNRALFRMREGLSGKEIDLVRAVSVSHEVINEEIVKLIWTYEIFCDLLDLAFFIGRQKLRTDRSVNDVKKDFPYSTS